ncbi:MAG: arginyltransferase [Phycisphaerales bacterium]|nr:arginyltransferase [Phycisphaerales bacterium]
MSDTVIPSDALMSLPVVGPMPCPYLPGREAAHRGFQVDFMPGDLYEALLDLGWRRSGEVFYTLACPQCEACIPLRVEAADFHPTRSQRRVRRRNRDVIMTWGDPQPTDEKADLYRRYIASQHDGQMTGSPEEHERFLYDSPTQSIETVYRVGERIVGVGILDVTPSCLSSVYFYFDPQERSRSLGTLSVLCEIELCQKLSKRYYHLGHWVVGARTMDYKAKFGPHELLGTDHVWRSPDQADPALKGPTAGADDSPVTARSAYDVAHGD